MKEEENNKEKKYKHWSLEMTIAVSNLKILHSINTPNTPKAPTVPHKDWPKDAVMDLGKGSKKQSR